MQSYDLHDDFSICQQSLDPLESKEFTNINITDCCIMNRYYQLGLSGRYRLRSTQFTHLDCRYSPCKFNLDAFNIPTENIYNCECNGPKCENKCWDLNPYWCKFGVGHNSDWRPF